MPGPVDIIFKPCHSFAFEAPLTPFCLAWNTFLLMRTAISASIFPRLVRIRRRFPRFRLDRNRSRGTCYRHKTIPPVFGFVYGHASQGCCFSECGHYYLRKNRCSNMNTYIIQIRSNCFIIKRPIPTENTNRRFCVFEALNWTCIINLNYDIYMYR